MSAHKSQSSPQKNVCFQMFLRRNVPKDLQENYFEMKLCNFNTVTTTSQDTVKSTLPKIKKKKKQMARLVSSSSPSITQHHGRTMVVPEGPSPSVSTMQITTETFNVIQAEQHRPNIATITQLPSDSAIGDCTTYNNGSDLPLFNKYELELNELDVTRILFELEKAVERSKLEVVTTVDSQPMYDLLADEELFHLLNNM